MLVAAAAFVGPVQARVGVHGSALTQSDARLWAVQLRGDGRGVTAGALRGLRANGVDAVVVDVQHFAPSRGAIRRFDALRRLAARESLVLVAVLPRDNLTAVSRHARARCARHARALRCATKAGSLSSAAALGRRGLLAAVFVTGPSGFARYAARAPLRRHVLVLVKLYGTFDPWVWSDVLNRATTSRAADLGVAPTTSLTAQPVQQYLSALSSNRKSGVPPPSNLATSDTARQSITLSWTEATTNVAGYRLYRNGKQVATSSTTSYAYGSLSCGTSYTLGVSAYSPSGYSSTVTKTNGTTSACVDTTAPSIPAGLLTSNVSQSSVTLSWSASTDNVGVAGYRLYVDGAAVATTSGTSYVFGGLACWVTPGDGVYSFGVSAYDAAGNTSAVATVAQQTQQCTASGAPSTPTGLATSNVGQTSMTLSWSPSTSGVGLAGYRLSRNGTQVGTTSTTSYAFTGLTCGTSYTLGVTAVDVTGAVSGTATLTQQTQACPGDTTPPTTPAALQASDVEQSSVSVAWNASTDNVGVAGYRLYQDGVQIGSTASTSYAFTSLACSTGPGTAVYTFGVAAFDAAGNVSATQSLDQETLPCGGGDTTPPTTPSGLAVSNVASSSVTLSWSPSTDNVGVTGYVLYRDGAQVGTATGTSYDFSGLGCGTTYTLGVAATDAAGNVSAPASTPGTTAPCSGGGGGSGTANLWVDTSGGTCTRTASPAAYADSAACASFNAAYQAAQPGDTVLIKGGSYGAQTIAVSATKTNAAADVVMSVDSGSTVTVNGALTIYGSHLVLRGESATNRSLRVPYYSVSVDPVGAAQVGTNRTNHVTVRYVAGANFQVGPGTYLTLDSNDWGPSIACNASYPSSQTEDQISWDGNYSGIVPDHVTISNSLIHDMNSDNTLSCHMGGLNIQGFNALTLTGNQFYRNAIYDIEFDEFTGSQAVSGLVMENNWFGPPVGTNDHRNGTNPAYADAGQADVQVKWDGHAASDWLVAFNSFSQGFSPEWGGAPPSYSNFRVLANVGGTITSGGWLFCASYGKPGVTYAYNVMLGFTMGSNPGGSPACGGAGAVSLGTSAKGTNEYNFAALPYVLGSSQSLDFHLAGAPGSTPADNIVVPGTGDYGLLSDFDASNSRPHDTNRDAGSDER